MTDPRPEVEQQVCFVISPIGEKNSPERTRADQFLKFIVKPVVEPRFKAIRADHISEPGIVTSQVVRYLVDSPLVIADLTDRNPNVMYELAIRHASHKPFVQLMAQGQALPFDIGQQRTIFFDINDLDSVDQCKKTLGEYVEAALKQEFNDTPIARMVEINNIAGTGPRDEVLSQLISRLDGLEAKLDRSRYGLDPAVNELLRQMIYKQDDDSVARTNANRSIHNAVFRLATTLAKPPITEAAPPAPAFSHGVPGGVSQELDPNNPKKK